jgi:hypothetical protein
MQRRRSLKGSWLVVTALVAGMALAYSQSERLYDWWRLQGYEPTAAVSQLASDATFTDQGTHLYYINRPEITAKSSFSQRCSSQQEQTIVLGCYHGVQRGIYILKISSDDRLDGVMQVTAAHEMLHAAYDRLSTKERQQVDGWLTDYYDHKLTDERIKNTINSYKQSEPDALVNEMHSIFGSEIAALPPQLETYYSEYFSNRQVVTSYAAEYQAEFTSRQQLVKQYDAQLTQLKKSIETNEAELRQRAAVLTAEAAELERLRRSGQTAEYNSRVAGYNAKVSDYTGLANVTRAQISEYNRLVEARNNVALEQQQLAQELSGEDVSTIPKQ